jgi:hypothetical protein
MESPRRQFAAPNPLPIVKPCSESWDRMQGDERKRFCDKCGLHVHNLSAMSGRERDHFVQNREAKDCVAYVAVADERILVPEEPSPQVGRIFRKVLTWALALFTPIFGVGCAARRSESAGDYATPPPELVSTDHREVFVTAGVPVLPGKPAPPQPSPTPRPR